LEWEEVYFMCTYGRCIAWRSRGLLQ
jgi:hypothetical protein